MKKLLVLLTVVFAFGLDFTFTKAFQQFNAGVRMVKTNPDGAQEHFKKSFELIQTLKHKDSSQVYYMLGRMYCNGWGTQKDYNLAEKYFKKSLQLGNQRAHCCLARLYLKEGKIDLAKKHYDIAKKNKLIANYCKDIDETKFKEQQ